METMDVTMRALRTERDAASERALKDRAALAAVESREQNALERATSAAAVVSSNPKHQVHFKLKASHIMNPRP